jgi:hypothetical protein
VPDHHRQIRFLRAILSASYPRAVGRIATYTIGSRWTITPRCRAGWVTVVRCYLIQGSSAMTCTVDPAASDAGLDAQDAVHASAAGRAGRIWRAATRCARRGLRLAVFKSEAAEVLGSHLSRDIVDVRSVLASIGAETSCIKLRRKISS